MARAVPTHIAVIPPSVNVLLPSTVHPINIKSFMVLYTIEGGTEPKKKGRMPLTTLDASVADFATVFGKFKAETARKKLVLFLADKDPVSQQSWCPGNSIFLNFIGAFAI